ncbi:MAG TPA: hypothetical protein DCR40_18060 [Prolixibacteraceae bacterium]|nr:hypothetical protein [Prolixibacteraceae bacterium]
MWIKKNADGSSNSFNFTPPSGSAAQVKEVLFPIAEVQVPAYAATLAVTIKQMETFLQPATLTGAVTINVTVDAQVTPGAKLHLKLTADGTQCIATIGTGFDAAAPDLTVAISSTVFKSYTYDGTAFVPS